MGSTCGLHSSSLPLSPDGGLDAVARSPARSSSLTARAPLERDHHRAVTAAPPAPGGVLTHLAPCLARPHTLQDSIMESTLHCRQHASLFDVSHMCGLSLKVRPSEQLPPRWAC